MDVDELTEVQHLRLKKWNITNYCKTEIGVFKVFEIESILPCNVLCFINLSISVSHTVLMDGLKYLRHGGFFVGFFTSCLGY